MFPFPSPCRKHKGIFLRYLLWKPGRAPADKSHNIELQSDWVPRSY